MAKDATYSLLCPFLDHDPRFAHGVEFGMLWADLTTGTEDRIASYFTTQNQDQILLAASRLGWAVVKMEPWELFPDHWFYLEMERPKTG
jgi:hypothetical protein